MNKMPRNMLPIEDDIDKFLEEQKEKTGISKYRLGNNYIRSEARRRRQLPKEEESDPS